MRESPSPVNLPYLIFDKSFCKHIVFYTYADLQQYIRNKKKKISETNANNKYFYYVPDWLFMTVFSISDDGTSREKLVPYISKIDANQKRIFRATYYILRSLYHFG